MSNAASPGAPAARTVRGGVEEGCPTRESCCEPRGRDTSIRAVITWLLVSLALLGLAVAIVAAVVAWARRHAVEPLHSSPPMGPRWLGRLFPEKPAYAFVAAVVTAALLGVALVLLGVASNRARYGWTLFVL